MNTTAFSVAGTRHDVSTNPSEWQVFRKTYDAHNQRVSSPTLVRSEGDAPVADAVVNAAHDSAKTVYDFYRDVLGRHGITGEGGDMTSVAHSVFGLAGSKNNAAWNGSQMLYGDGDGVTFGPFAYGLDVVAHELTHGVTEHTAGLIYSGQSGALNESWSDVMGELVQLWKQDPAKFGDVEFTRAHKWVSGEDIFTPSIPGDAGRSLEAPGTANPHDKQPADMAHYVRGGNVHLNSGIPNHAAYKAAIQIGGDKLAKVWYQALAKHLKPSSDFSDAARSTILAAQELYPNEPAVSQAVADAWTGVGVDPKGHTGQLDDVVPGDDFGTFGGMTGVTGTRAAVVNGGWGAPFAKM